MKYVIKTLGCKVNQSESEQIASELSEGGLSQAVCEHDADIIIINTCTVTSVADAKARQLISRAARNKKAKVLVTGCGVNNKDSGFDKFKNVDLLTNKNKINWVGMDGFINDEKKENVQVLEKSEGRRAVNSFRSRALLKIQDGCDRRCSYCIVPFVRGPSKSITADAIIRQADGLVKKGNKEIVLTGVDIGTFNDKGLKLDGLIKQILDLDSTFRIRLSSLEPQSITETFLNLFLGEERLCNHIHIPLQSGSDAILKAMKRPYTVDEIMSLVERMKIKKDIAFTSDVIVGFPGESESDFNRTRKVISNIGFSKIHIFRYSERPSTEAVSIYPKVSEEAKKQRALRLRITAEETQNNFRKELVGKKLQVFVERKQGAYYKSLTSNYCTVLIEGNVKKGTLADIKIERFHEGRLFGKLV